MIQPGNQRRSVVSNPETIGVVRNSHAVSVTLATKSDHALRSRLKAKVYKIETGNRRRIQTGGTLATLEDMARLTSADESAGVYERCWGLG